MIGSYRVGYLSSKNMTADVLLWNMRGHPFLAALGAVIERQRNPERAHASLVAWRGHARLAGTHRCTAGL